MTSTTGRKPSYTAEALEEAITRADTQTPDGREATTAEVKRALLAATGIRSVNDASLRDHIEEVRAARKKRHEDSLVAALPSFTAHALDQSVEAQRRAMLVAIGEAYEALQKRHDAQLTEVEREKRMLAISLRDAQDAVAARETEIDRVRDEREAAYERIAALEADLAAARQSNAEKAAGEEATQRVLELIADAVRASGRDTEPEDPTGRPEAGGVGE